MYPQRTARMAATMPVFGLGLGLGRDGAVPPPTTPPTALETVGTDASTTPTTVRMTVAAGQSAVRVFTGVPAGTNAQIYAAYGTPYYDLYYNRNGGTTYKVRVYYWDSYTIAANVGDTIAFGTSDGRSLRACQMTAPTVGALASGQSLAIPTDKAWPSVWTPRGAHAGGPIPLTTYERRIGFPSTGTEYIVWIAEFDYASFAPAYWVRVPASGGLTVQLAYNVVALATDDGRTLTVTAPATWLAFGRSVTASLTFPTPATTYDVTTVAEFNTAVAAAVAPAKIRFASGTYALTSQIVSASFVANVAAGNKGCEGIVFESLTGVAADVTLTGDGTGTHGDWNLINTAINTQKVGFRNLTFDFTGISARMTLNGVYGGAEGCVFKGVASTAGYDSVAFAATATAASVFDFLFCTAQDAKTDCWNADGAAATNAASLVRLIGCVGARAGVNANDQVVTNHTGLPLVVEGGSFTDATANVAAPDSTSVIYLFWATTGPGSHQGGLKRTGLFGCTCTVDVTNPLDPNVTGLWLLFNTITLTNAIASTSLIRSGTTPIVFTVRHNRLASVTGLGRAYFESSLSADFVGNLVTTWTNGLLVSTSGGLTGTIAAHSNTFDTAPVSLTDATLAVAFNNNAGTSASGTQLTGGTATTTGDYNTLRATTTYTPGAHDTTGANAALTATTRVPTAAGNCDDNGDQSLYNYVGGRDAWGALLVRKSGTVHRGAISRPHSSSGQQLVDDRWTVAWT